ncbi:TetR/AcrR family transcriptional regulator [Mycobacterium sp. ITM-2016-00318]|uniref:TetR/AcrR family transcriptional regulator n=1 Tax=Mycobacterium sp. ITM-2016-00318 TaxID=2099693 RepID=UPI000CF9EB79|nr:TetR/AcrR family transcriptional regulator [Mycobacterium sp. ITM-2016-00318]WNG92564.1 TetR family transcriptional regulator [Mycobacterium sp. ITM-2016-00318]
MPPNPERRNQILDAAIDILCDDGVGGLTHRQVDSRAGVPAGTTSNYFRTRQALLEATAARTVDLHWRRVGALQSTVGPMSRDTLRVLLIRMLEVDEQLRRWTLARFELFMESTRREELQPLMRELQAAAVKSATLIFEAAGFTVTPERMDELSRVLNGFVFSNLTLAPEPGTQDAAGFVDRLLSAFLD